ncbi:rod-binding protein [Novosphingobium sp. MBES04]|uniref:rod-binding protein n=1 Tax=Novosphingobium sp. MBES04 TaxID=1206458 RepID=UPI00057C9AF1|nr:rod-binding protein [Novosphingobium sp. MBES04]GAM03397.1 flagellar protein FlgJ [Novosphingobium sp. MBES04]
MINASAPSTSLILSPEKGMDRTPGATAREELAQAAKQFEAIFVRQMLAEARKTHFDKDGIFSSSALDTFRQMQDERFAEIAAQTGTLGLASVIEAQLARHLPPEAPTEPAAAPPATSGDR